MQATRRRVHCVLLIVQPLECADDAGFTLVQSHCSTLHSGLVRLSCSSSYFYALHFCMFFSYANVSGDHANSGIIKDPDAECGHTSNWWISQHVLTHISQKFYEVQVERKSSWMKRAGGGRGRDIWEWKKPLCFSGMQPNSPSAKEGSHWSPSQRNWKLLLPISSE